MRRVFDFVLAARPGRAILAEVAGLVKVWLGILALKQCEQVDSIDSS